MSQSDEARQQTGISAAPTPCLQANGWEQHDTPREVVEDAPWRPELKMIMKLAVPTIVQSAAQQAMLVTDQLFVGHLGTNSLAAAALGNTYSNIMWFFLLGASTALDTIGAQAFGGGQHGALVLVAFTSSVVLSVMSFLLSVALCFGKQVAESPLFGQEEEVAHLVGEYCWGLVPGMWPLVLALVLMKYLQAQNIMMVPAIITVVAFLLNIGFNAALITVLGFKGAPIATSISRFCQFVLLAVAVMLHERRRRQSGPSAVPLLSVTSSDRPDADDAVRNNSHRPDAHTVDGNDSADPEQPLMSSGTNSSQPPGDAWPRGDKGDAEVQLVDLPQQYWSSNGHSPVPDHTTTGGRGPVSGGKPLTWLRMSTWQHLVRETWNQGPLLPSGTWMYFMSQLQASMHLTLLSRYLKLALPGGFMLAFEACSFEVTTAMAGHLGSAVTAAHAALLGVVALTYTALPFAVATATTIRVGNLLGAGLPVLARKSGYLSIAISVSFMTIAAIIILSCRHFLGRAFSSDPEVISTMAMVAPFAALFQVFDGVLGASQGILRGCGRQLHLMVTNLVGFWLLGVLLGYMLTFRVGLGIRGLWIGIASGDTAAASLNMILVLLINWKREAQKAAERVNDMQPTTAAAAPEVNPQDRPDFSHRRRMQVGGRPEHTDTSSI